MRRGRLSWLALPSWVLASFILASCGDGADMAITPSTPVPTATPATQVVVSMTAGCFRREDDPRTTVRALVHVESPDGDPVVGATVDGEVEGPGVVHPTGRDATFNDGNALLAFGISEFGEYTMTVVGITLPNGLPADIDPSSTLQISHVVGEVCVSP